MGVFRLVDKGDNDDKILAVPHTDPLFSEYRDLGDVPMHFMEEMEHFFTVPCPFCLDHAGRVIACMQRGYMVES